MPAACSVEMTIKRETRVVASDVCNGATATRLCESRGRSKQRPYEAKTTAKPLRQLKEPISQAIAQPFHVGHLPQPDARWVLFARVLRANGMT